MLYYLKEIMFNSIKIGVMIYLRKWLKNIVWWRENMINKLHIIVIKKSKWYGRKRLLQILINLIRNQSKEKLYRKWKILKMMGDN